MDKINKTKHEKISWDEINLGIQFLFNELTKQKFKPDIILAVSRGGVIPGVMLSHKFTGIDMRVVYAKKHLTDSMWPDSKKIVVEMPAGIPEQKNILLIDDIVGEGDTMKAVLDKIHSYKELKVVSLFFNELRCKETKIVDLNYKYSTNWIQFPWEKDLGDED